MATGGAFLVLVVWLWTGLLPEDPSLAQEGDTQISLPLHLEDLIPEAAEATVAAGYTNSGQAETVTIAELVPPGPTVVSGTIDPLESASLLGSPVAAIESISKMPEVSVAVVESGGTVGEALGTTGSGGGGGTVGAPVEVVTVGALADDLGIVGTPVEVATVGVVSQRPPAKEEVLILGDTRYEWQEWSHWHCNCPAGSMSRVRDITYSVPGVRLDPVEYNVLRFEREVCSYKACRCDRKAHECDRLEVTCKEEAKHMCALKDIEHDQARKRDAFWSQVHEGLKHLWLSMKQVFPERETVHAGRLL